MGYWGGGLIIESETLRRVRKATQTTRQGNSPCRRQVQRASDPLFSCVGGRCWMRKYRSSFFEWDNASGLGKQRGCGVGIICLGGVEEYELTIVFSIDD